MSLKQRLVAAALITAATVPVAMPRQNVSAAGATDCAGTMTWTMPSSTAFVFSGTVTQSWNRTCAAVNPAGAPFGAVTVNPDSTGSNQLVSPFAGNCLLGFSSNVDNGMRFFIGPLEVGAGVQGTSAAGDVGLLGVPQGTPCGGGTVTWSGAEDFFVEG